MWIRISGRRIDDFGKLRSGSVTGWGSWYVCHRWCRLWSLLSASVGRRCTCSFASPSCLRMFRGAMLATKASGRVVLTKYSWLYFHCSLYHHMPRKLNTLLRIFSDLGARLFVQILPLLYCGARKPFFAHLGHIHGQANVGLFQLYTTSLPCHHTRLVECVQDINCCFKRWDAAITSTLYASLSSSKVINACFVQSWECLSGNLYAKIPSLTTSSCSISWTAHRNALVNHRGFRLQTAIDWSCSSRRTPAVWYTVNWRPLTTVWI